MGDELAQLSDDQCPKCIYTSPTTRTLGTAMEIAKKVKLPIVVIPGLSACAAAVKRGKLMKAVIQKEDNQMNSIQDNQNGTNGQQSLDDEEEKIESNAVHEHPPLDSFADTAKYELFLQSYAWIGQCDFLTKQQVLEEFGGDGVKIYFDYRNIERFRVSLERVIMESESSVVLCVTHREGIRKIDGRLRRTNIPYCALAKYGAISSGGKSQDLFQFLYFE